MDLKKAKTLHDLSIYESTPIDSRELWVALPDTEKSQLETMITSVRQGACSIVKQIKKSTEQATQYYDQSKKSADNKLTHLRSESTVLPKVVFISLSTMSGFLIGFRRSTIRKVFYSGVLAAGSTALCYPNEAKMYSSKASEFVGTEAKQLYRTYIWPEQVKVKKERVIKEDTQVFNSKDKVIKLNKEDVSSVIKSEMVGNKGMSNDDDSDMYTTRSK